MLKIVPCGWRAFLHSPSLEDSVYRVHLGDKEDCAKLSVNWAHLVNEGKLVGTSINWDHLVTKDCRGVVLIEFTRLTQEDFFRFSICRARSAKEEFLCMINWTVWLILFDWKVNFELYKVVVELTWPCDWYKWKVKLWSQECNCDYEMKKEGNEFWRIRELSSH